MRVSSLYGVALKEAPSDADSAGHRFLLRAGYIRQLGSGLFSALPLGRRALRKIEQILREEMDAIGGQEVAMPVVHPAALSHAAVVARHARAEVSSYRQLPMLVYQLQTRLHDAPQARGGGGLIHARERVMKDSCSLDRDQHGLERQCAALGDAYQRIFARCGLPVAVVACDPGTMGGRAADGHMYVSDIGDDRIARCDGCGYAASRAVARFRRSDADADADAAPGPLARVSTPGAKTIAGLADVLGIEPAQTAKAVMFVASWADPGRPEQVVLAMVRGDTEVNEGAVGRAVGAQSLRPAEEAALLAVGLVPGYAGPVGLTEGAAIVVVDGMLQGGGFVSGANEADTHLWNVTVGRDFSPDVVAEIAMVFAGAPCVDCGTPLSMSRVVKVGDIVQLGTRYTEAVQARFIDDSGKGRPIVMGGHGIDVWRLLACLAEEHHDSRGLTLPMAVAPFVVCVVALARKAATREGAEALYDGLRRAGVAVLFDDRPKVSAGVKLAEADLRGVPLRVVVSDRGLKQGTCELAWRASGTRWTEPIGQAVDAIQQALAAAQEEATAASSARNSEMTES